MQAMKAQALTLLATWVVADSSHSVAGRIRQQDLPARILEDLVNRAHHFLPGPHGQMAVQVSLLHACPSVPHLLVTAANICSLLVLESAVAQSHLSSANACQQFYIRLDDDVL